MSRVDLSSTSGDNFEPAAARRGAVSPELGIFRERTQSLTSTNVVPSIHENHAVKILSTGETSKEKLLQAFGSYENLLMASFVNLHEEGMEALLDAMVSTHLDERVSDTTQKLTKEDVIDLLVEMGIEHADETIPWLIQLCVFKPNGDEKQVLLDHEGLYDDIKKVAVGGEIDWKDFIDKRLMDHKMYQFPSYEGQLSRELMEELVSNLSLDQVEDLYVILEKLLDDDHGDTFATWIVQFLEAQKSQLDAGENIEKLRNKVEDLDNEIVYLSLEKMVDDSGVVNWNQWINTPPQQLRIGLISQNMALHDLLQRLSQLPVDRKLGVVEGYTQRQILNMLFSVEYKYMGDLAPHLVQLIDQNPAFGIYLRLSIMLAVHAEAFIHVLDVFSEDNGGTIDWDLWFNVSDEAMINVMTEKTLFVDLQEVLHASGIELEAFKAFVFELPLTVAALLDADEAATLYKICQNLSEDGQKVVINYIRYLKTDELRSFLLNTALLLAFTPDVLELLQKAPGAPVLVRKFVLNQLLHVPAKHLIGLIEQNPTGEQLLAIERVLRDAASYSTAGMLKNCLNTIAAISENKQLDWVFVSKAQGDHFEKLELIIRLLELLSEDLPNEISVALKSYILKPHPTERLAVTLNTITEWLQIKCPNSDLLRELAAKGDVGCELFFIRKAPEWHADLMEINEENLTTQEMDAIVSQQLGYGAMCDVGKMFIEFLAGKMNWKLYGDYLKEIGLLYGQFQHAEIKNYVVASDILKINPAGLADLVLLHGRGEGVEQVAFIKDDKMRAGVMAYMNFLEVEELDIDYKQVVDILNSIPEARRGDLVKVVPFVLFAPKSLLPMIKKEILRVDIQNPEKLFNKAQYALYRNHLDHLDQQVNKMLLGKYYGDIRNAGFGLEILKAAQHFLTMKDQFQWIKSSETAITKIDLEFTFNDFILFFKYPEKMVKEEHARISELVEFVLTDRQIAPEGKLQMCCWEFVMLTMVKAGAVTLEDIRNVYSAGNTIRGVQHLVVQAMAGGASFEWYPTLSEGKAQPGDVLIYLNPEKPGKVPKHASIYVKENEVIELLTQSIRTDTVTGTSPEMIHVIPAEVVARNIQKFIRGRYRVGNDIQIQQEVKEYKEHKFMQTAK